MRIPVVDLSGPDEVSIKVIREACRDLGFFQVINHGVDPALLDAARTSAASFFALPAEEKGKFPLQFKGEHLSGYASLGAEASDVANLSLTGRDAHIDLMESFQFSDPALGRNNVPETGGMASVLPPLYGAMRQFGDRLLRLTAAAAGCEDTGVFARAHEGGTHRTVLRVTNYPSLQSIREEKEKEVDDGAVGGADVEEDGSRKGTERKVTGLSRIAPHRDLGTLTLLFQDNRGGLEVQDPRACGGGCSDTTATTTSSSSSSSSAWVPVPPVEGAAVINVGNLLTRWTNGLFRSSIHRVVTNETAEAHSRMSVICFENPRNDTVVGPLPHTISLVGERKYDDVQVGKYLDCKLTQLFDPDARNNKGTCKYDD